VSFFFSPPLTRIYPALRISTTVISGLLTSLATGWLPLTVRFVDTVCFRDHDLSFGSGACRYSHRADMPEVLSPDYSFPSRRARIFHRGGLRY